MRKRSMLAIASLFAGAAVVAPNAAAAPPAQSTKVATAAAAAAADQAAEPEVVYVRPVADGEIRDDGKPINLSGTSLLSRAGTGPSSGESYMRFDLSAYAGRVQGAELLMHSLGSRNQRLAVGRIDSDWTAKDYTYANRPILLSVMAQTSITGVGQREINVGRSVATAASQGSGVLDLALRPNTSDASTYLRVVSTEGGNDRTAPRLKLTLSPIEARASEPRFLRISNADAAYPLRYLREVSVIDDAGRKVSLRGIKAVGDDSANGGRAIDGNMETAWRARSAGDALVLDLGKPTAVSAVSVARVGAASQSVAVAGSSNGSTWTAMGTGRDIPSQPSELVIFTGEDAQAQQVHGVATRTPAVESRESILKRLGSPAGGNSIAGSSKVYVEKGALVQIWTKKPRDKGTTVGYWAKGAKFPLKPGATTFRAKYSGPILLRAWNDTVPEKVDFYVSASHAHRTINYYLGRGTNEQFWKRFNAAPEPADPGQIDVILESDRQLILVPRNKMKAAYQLNGKILNVEQLMKDYVKMIAAQDAMLGLNTTTGGVHGLMRKKEVIDPGGSYIATTGASTKVNPEVYPTKVLNPETTGTFFGLNHEMGHTRDGRMKCMYATGEGTTNLFSYAGLKALSIDRGEPWDPQYPALMNAGVDTANYYRGTIGLDSDVWFWRLPKPGSDIKNKNGNTRLMMQAIDIQIAYYGSDKYWANYFRTLRELLPNEKTNELSKLPVRGCNQLIYVLSRGNEVDFRPYFAAWGIETSAEANRLIDGLKLTRTFDPAYANRKVPVPPAKP